MLPDLLNDVRYSARSLVRAPVWTITLILTIALGIGSSASVQGFALGLIRTTLPISGIDSLVSIVAIDEAGGVRLVTDDDYQALAARTEIFEQLGAVRESQERVAIGQRSALMAVAEFTPVIGALLPLPARAGAALSHRVRFTDFDPRVDPLGRDLAVGGRLLRISGTLPDWLEGLYRDHPIDLWIPRPVDGPRSGAADLSLVGRLRPGVSLSAARAAINTGRETPLTLLPYTGLTPEAAIAMQRVGSLLGLAAAAVFVIACANVASFLMSRSSARARETAVRVAIGARRRQLARQMLVDSVLISVLGGAAGFVLAMWLADIVPLMFFDQVAEKLVFAPDTLRVAITALTCVAITIASGLAPLLDTRHDAPSIVLQREVAGPSRTLSRLGTALVLIQMIGCTVLVISTGLLLQGFAAAVQTNAGQRLGDPVLVTGEIVYRTTRAELSTTGLDYFDALERAARAVTDVSGTVWMARLPGARAAWQSFRIDRPASAHRETTLAITPLTPHVMETLQLPPVKGRLYRTSDAGRCGGAVINETAAATLFDGEAIGRQIVSSSGRALEVVGIVGDRSAAPTLYEYLERRAPITAGEPMAFRAPVSPGEAGLLDVNVVSSNFFDAMGFTRVDGRLFEASSAGCRIAVVNEEAASRYFGGKAVGAAVIDTEGRRTEIVGVVRSALLRRQQRRVEPAIYLPMFQDVLMRMSVLMDADSTSTATLNRMRQNMWSVPGGRPDRLVVTTLDRHLSATALAPERIASVLVGVFAVIALALGVLGLYGVMADSARRRRREFAVRLALGAQGWRVVRQLMREGMVLAGAGVAVGMAASFLVARWLAAIAPGAGAPSLTVLLAAPILLTTAVLLATVVPARHALSVDLLSIMRDS